MHLYALFWIDIVESAGSDLRSAMPLAASFCEGVISHTFNTATADYMIRSLLTYICHASLTYEMNIWLKKEHTDLNRLEEENDSSFWYSLCINWSRVIGQGQKILNL